MACRRVAVPMFRLLLLLLAGAMWVIPIAPARAQPLSAALRVPNPLGTGPFGRALAGRAGKIVVGPGAGQGGNVYVIDGVTGATLLTIVNPSPAIDDWFGFSVAWVGDDVLVGAPLSDDGGPNRGVAYVFDGATGMLLHTLTRPDTVNGWFGYSVAGFGDDALVGSAGPLGPNGEGVYLFDGASGAPLQSFSDPNANTPQAGRFGWSVVADGSEVLIASTFGVSAVYRFDAAGTLLQTYLDPEPLDAEEFGSAIAVVGSHVAIGVGINSGGGEVYLFDAVSGALEHTYDPPFFSDNLYFGMSVGAAADHVAIGSSRGVFVHATTPPFDAIQHLQAPAPFSDDHDGFGQTLASLDDALLVGAVSTVYVFDLCGNGVQTAREQCDDGNLVGGDGCSGQCQLETCGAAPAMGCVAATKSQISLRDENSIYGIKDTLKWTWVGAATDLATLGDPMTTADLSLCIYDHTDTVAPRLRMQPAMLAGGTCAGRPCWRRLGSSGYGYGDKDRTPSGISRFTAKTGGSGTKVAVLGGGPDLGVPEATGGSIPFAGQVTIQLRSRTTSGCLSADFPLPASVNVRGFYRDKTD